MVLRNRLFLHVARIRKRLDLILIVINIKLNTNELPLLLYQLISQLRHLLLGYLRLDWTTSHCVHLDEKPADLSIFVLDLMLEQSYLVLIGIDLLIYPYLLFVVSLPCLHLHREHLLLCAVYLGILVGYHLVQTDYLRLQHLLLACHSCDYGVLLVDLLLVEGQVGFESRELLSQVGERLLPLLHLLLEVSVFTSNRIEITGKLLNCSVFLVKEVRALLELVANPGILLIELIDILLLCIQLFLQLGILSPLIPHLIIEPGNHRLPREDLILKVTHITLETEDLSAHPIELLTLAIQISLVVIHCVLQLTDILGFVVELLSEAIVLILQLVYLALQVEDLVVGSLVVLLVVVAVLFSHD